MFCHSSQGNSGAFWPLFLDLTNGYFMNAKKAKLLRKRARIIGSGLEDKQLVWNKNKTRAVNNRATVRGIYMELKCLYRNVNGIVNSDEFIGI